MTNERFTILGQVDRLFAQQVNGGEVWRDEIASFTTYVLDRLEENELNLYLADSFLRRMLYPESFKSTWSVGDNSNDIWWSIWRNLDYRALSDWTYEPPTDDPVMLSAMRRML